MISKVSDLFSDRVFFENFENLDFPISHFSRHHVGLEFSVDLFCDFERSPELNLF